MKIKTNTYPIHPKVCHGYPGEEVQWSLERGAYHLIRKSDGKSVFMSPPVNKDGMLHSTGKPFNLLGVIAQVKKKNQILELDNNTEV